MSRILLILTETMVQVIARTPFGNTLVHNVCRDMNDVEANEAVVNKNGFDKSQMLRLRAFHRR